MHLLERMTIKMKWCCTNGLWRHIAPRRAERSHVAAFKTAKKRIVRRRVLCVAAAG